VLPAAPTPKMIQGAIFPVDRNYFPLARLVITPPPACTGQTALQSAGIGLAIAAAMTETKYAKVFAQFLNEYWGAFHEVLEAQSVNPHRLAPSLFDTLMTAHRRFAAVDGFAGGALERLGGLWDVVAARRTTTAHAPLSAREIQFARAQFEAIHDLLMARGKVFPRAAAEALTHAAHAHPRAALRADSAR
jgi:hypothetical protein